MAIDTAMHTGLRVQTGNRGPGPAETSQTSAASDRGDKLLQSPSRSGVPGGPAGARGGTATRDTPRWPCFLEGKGAAFIHCANTKPRPAAVFRRTPRCTVCTGSIDGGSARFPCSKLKLDNLFLQWLSMPESQTLVRSELQLTMWLAI